MEGLFLALQDEYGHDKSNQPLYREMMIVIREVAQRLGMRLDHSVTHSSQVLLIVNQALMIDVIQTKEIYIQALLDIYNRPAIEESIQQQQIRLETKQLDPDPQP